MGLANLISAGGGGRLEELTLLHSRKYANGYTAAVQTIDDEWTSDKSQDVLLVAESGISHSPTQYPPITIYLNDIELSSESDISNTSNVEMDPVYKYTSLWGFMRGRALSLTAGDKVRIVFKFGNGNQNYGFFAILGY